MISEDLFESTRLAADELASQLQRRRKKIVFAESCTAGLASAVMGQISGISNWHCGSAVTYRVPVKEDWLQIDPDLIETFTAVSPQVTQAMAQSVLLKTDDADYSIGITGHLEPDKTIEPSVFVSVGYRIGRRIACSEPQRFRLVEATRCDRQWEATRFALKAGVRHLRDVAESDNSHSTLQFVKLRKQDSEFQSITSKEIK